MPGAKGFTSLPWSAPLSNAQWRLGCHGRSKTRELRDELYLPLGLTGEVSKTWSLQAPGRPYLPGFAVSQPVVVRGLGMRASIFRQFTGFGSEPLPAASVHNISTLPSKAGTSQEGLWRMILQSVCNPWTRRRIISAHSSAPINISSGSLSSRK